MLLLCIATAWRGRSNACRGTDTSLACRYIFALYWAITTLATVGYGDLSAANPAEAAWATIYMFFNLALGAYVLGTITLIVIKHDERTGRYRDLTTHLKDYIKVNEIPAVSPRHLWLDCFLSCHEGAARVGS